MDKPAMPPPTTTTSVSRFEVRGVNWMGSTESSQKEMLDPEVVRPAFWPRMTDVSWCSIVGGGKKGVPRMKSMHFSHELYEFTRIENYTNECVLAGIILPRKRRF